MLYGCVKWSPRACHYDKLRRAHHRFLARCIDWRKHNRADDPISYLDTLVKTGSESIEATLRRRRILFGGFVARMEDTRLPKCVMFGELEGNGAGKGVDGVFPGRPQRFRHQRRPVDDCSPGRAGMAQNGGTSRGGTFQGKMDRCRKKQKAGLRHAVVNPVDPYSCYICVIIHTYIHASVPIATRVFFFFWDDVAFSEYFFVPFPLSLCMDYRVRRTFFPSEWSFSTLWPRAGFLTSADVRIQSNQSIKKAYTWLVAL